MQSVLSKKPAKINQFDFDEQTIKLVERYFGIQDQDALLKYVRDAVVKDG